MNLRLISIFLTIFFIAGCAPTGVIGIPTSIADRRTAGVQLEDESIELKALYEVNQLEGEKHTNILSYNRHVYILGEAATEELKAKIEEKISTIKEIKSITNELLVGKNSTIKSRAKDVAITTNVKALLVKDEKKSNLSALHVKVITERQTVYLFGLLNSNEAAEAEKISKRAKGIIAVKSFFEIDESLKNN
jgi:osmotically-inducible protein OsmY